MLLDVEAGLVAAPAHDVRLVVTLALRGGTLRHLGGLVAGGKGSRQAAASFGAAAADAPSESRSCRFVFPTVSRVTVHAHFMFAPEMTFAANVDALIDWKGAAAAVVLCPIFTVAAQGQRRLRTSQRRLRVCDLTGIFRKLNTHIFFGAGHKTVVVCAATPSPAIHAPTYCVLTRRPRCKSLTLPESQPLPCTHSPAWPVSSLEQR